MIDKQKFSLHKELEDGGGFIRAIKSGSILYISGSVGFGNMSGAVKQVYDELEFVLSHHKLTFHNVLKENIYTTNVAEFLKEGETRLSYYKGDYPTCTLVEVQGLFTKEAVLEVELVATF